MAREMKLSELLRRIERIPRAARAVIEKGLDDAAGEIVGSARSLAPVEDGALKGSIRSSRGSRPLSRVIEAGGEATTREVRKGSGATYDYALAQELGTVETPAQPFFYPAWRLGRKRARGKVRRAVSKAVKAAMGGS